MGSNMQQNRAPRNRTLDCSDAEIALFSDQLLCLKKRTNTKVITNQVICGDSLEIARFLPRNFVDLLILDPPYNLNKEYNGTKFRQKRGEKYAIWFADLLKRLMPLLKPDASAYICSDWQTSCIIAPVLTEFFKVQNRITWEREKGRGAKRNWKNNCEDIWFCTLNNSYYFDMNKVKIKRRVIAPYKENGAPKDWAAETGGNFRLTHPANLWTDISVPFWSMPENTDHPTQKPEKLIAKLILASCPEGGLVFDPFLGSGTSSVVAAKLGRRHCGVERDKTYCCWAKKRLHSAATDGTIQGYTGGVFWERNTQPQRLPGQRNKHQEEMFR
ncbi:MAG: site-specific DNA-methyltransferase [Cellvibrionales bacterium]|nr:site-specific DNA-methyltransferase [Cellvibrionales bacterium]